MLGAATAVAFADDKQDGNLGKRMLAHLVADLLVAQVGLNPQPGRLGRRRDLARIAIGVVGDRRHDPLHRCQP